MSGERRDSDGSLRVALLLFVAGWGANHFVALLPLYRASLSLRPTEASALFGVYALGLVPSLVLGGPLSDRLGRKQLVGPAAAVALLGTTILALSSQSFAGLLAGRFVVGLGSGAVFSAGSAWLVDRTGGGPRASVATIALSGGFGAGPLVAGAMASFVTAPLIAPYVTQLVAASLALVSALALRPGRGATQVTSQSTVAPDEQFGPRMTAASAPFVFVFPSFAMVVLPAAVGGNLGPRAALLAGSCAAIALLVGAWVQRSTSARSPASQARMGLSAGALGLAFGFVAARSGSLSLVLAACVPLGAGHGLTFAAGLRSTVARATPLTRGRAVGVFYALAYVGFAAPFAFFALAAAAGLPAAFGAFFALAAVLAAAGLKAAPARS